MTKIRTICRARELWELSRFVNNCNYYARQTSEIYQELPCSVDFKAPEELWYPLSKTIFSKCSLILNTPPVNMWNYRKAQK